MNALTLEDEDGEVLAVVPLDHAEGARVFLRDERGQSVGLLHVWREETWVAQVGGWDADGQWLGEPAPLVNRYQDTP